jgi:hypothetical protein
MSVQRSQEIEYAPKASSHGSYRMSKVLPLGNTTATLAASSTTEVQFEIPNKVYNLSKSSLDFEMQILEGTTASTVNRIHNNGLAMFDRVSLYDRSGVYLMDITNCNTYSNCLNQYVTPLDKMLTSDSSRGGATQALSRANDMGHNNFKSNVDDVTATPGVANGANGTRVGPDGEALAPSLSNSEICYFSQGVARDGTAAGQINVNFSIPLSELHHSICSLNKDLYFGQSLILRVHFAAVSRIGWSSTSATDLNTAVAAIANAVTLSGLQVNLAVEVSPPIVESIQNKVRGSGLELIIPYVYSYLFSSASGTSSNVQYRFNSGHGQRLLNVYHCVMNTGATSNVIYDKSNQADDKIVSYQTSMDNVPLQEARPVCAEGDDFMLHRHLLEKSCIQNLNIYRFNKLHIDSWRQGPCASWKERDGVADGLSLDNERIWASEFTTASAAYRHFTFAIVQRNLKINNNGSINVK